jgi:hypothetical protein
LPVQRLQPHEPMIGLPVVTSPGRPSDDEWTLPLTWRRCWVAQAKNPKSRRCRHTDQVRAAGGCLGVASRSVSLRLERGNIEGATGVGQTRDGR